MFFCFTLLELFTRHPAHSFHTRVIFHTVHLFSFDHSIDLPYIHLHTLLVITLLVAFFPPHHAHLTTLTYYCSVRLPSLPFWVFNFGEFLTQCTLHQKRNLLSFHTPLIFRSHGFGFSTLSFRHIDIIITLMVTQQFQKKLNNIFLTLEGLISLIGCGPCSIICSTVFTSFSEDTDLLAGWGRMGILNKK